MRKNTGPYVLETFSVTDTIRCSLTIVSPTLIAACKSKRPPAHMRRYVGSSSGLPSGPTSADGRSRLSRSASVW